MKINTELKEYIKDHYDLEITSTDPLILKSLDNENDYIIGKIAERIVSISSKEYEELQKYIQLDQIKSFPNEQQLLLTASPNYADEFDIAEWCICSVGDLRKIIDKHESIGDTQIEFCFGTNEFFRYSSYGEMLEEIDIKLISDEEYNTIENVFGISSFGSTGFFDNLFYNYDEEEYEEITYVDGTKTIFSSDEQIYVTDLLKIGVIVTIDESNSKRLFLSENGFTSSISRDELSYYCGIMEL